MAIQHNTATKRRDMGAAAMRTYPNISRRWGLKESEAALLLGVPDSTYRRWKQTPEQARLDANHLERMSLILGIYKALHILLPNPAQADGWVRRPNANALFEGRSPLTRMLGGRMRDLALVRHHLDGWRG